MPHATDTPFLLLQARDESDPMREQEVGCFARALGVGEGMIAARSLFDEVDPDAELFRHAAFFVGGSGDYSVAQGGEWLSRVCHWMETLVRLRRPLFASCFGFQAIALSLGSRVVTDLSRAEVGTIELALTERGRQDPLFGALPEPFFGQAGHQDIVEDVPEGATLLASSERTRAQAFRLDGLPIYCTQFHPELDREGLLDRVRNYPQYVEKIAGVPYEMFLDHCLDSKETLALIPRFVELLVG